MSAAEPVRMTRTVVYFAKLTGTRIGSHIRLTDHIIAARAVTIF
jgi:hypothetical protein